ncbi:hypothetical protein [Azospirillum canadense]|uniref:hypothetical protein n=1 Tax=Azospirillum canadense TaxID=403962 RepID=UPI0022266F14|nr:hypothetical protein [Azospirillum canadense]MCW2240966.1 hypothetical protein [Azospirillum canadense]
MTNLLDSAQAACERARTLQQRSRTLKARSVELRLGAEELFALVLMQWDKAVKARDGVMRVRIHQHFASALSAPVPEGYLDRTNLLRFIVGMDENTEALLWRSRWLRQRATKTLARIADLRMRIDQRASFPDQPAPSGHPDPGPERSG